MALSLLSLLALFVQSCSDSESPSESGWLYDAESAYVIHWEGGVWLRDVQFYLNGRYIGVGTKGLNWIASDMKRLRYGSKITIEFPVQETTDYQEHFGDIPFLPWPDELSELAPFQQMLSGPKSFQVEVRPNGVSRIPDAYVSPYIESDEAGSSEPGSAAPKASGRLALTNVVDLARDGANVFTFCSATRELFISHPSEVKRIYQWNIDTKSELHAYDCPSGYDRWGFATAVSPDGTLLVAEADAPVGSGNMNRVLFIDTRSHKTLFTAEYVSSVSKIRFDRSQKFLWIILNHGIPDTEVYAFDGTKHTEFDPNDFESEAKGQLWDVRNSKGKRPLPGLFYSDANGSVTRLAENPLNQNYSFNEDRRYIGTSTWDQHVRIWRTRGCKEVFNRWIGSHPVRLLYDSRDDRFLVIDGVDGNTVLRSVELSQEPSMPHQGGADHPATASESKPEGGEKPQPESERRSL